MRMGWTPATETEAIKEVSRPSLKRLPSGQGRNCDRADLQLTQRLVGWLGVSLELLLSFHQISRVFSTSTKKTYCAAVALRQLCSHEVATGSTYWYRCPISGSQHQHDRSYYAMYCCHWTTGSRRYTKSIAGNWCQCLHTIDAFQSA
jgi:hypothetical protein